MTVVACPRSQQRHMATLLCEEIGKIPSPRTICWGDENSLSSSLSWQVLPLPGGAPPSSMTASRIKHLLADVICTALNTVCNGVENLEAKIYKIPLLFAAFSSMGFRHKIPSSGVASIIGWFGSLTATIHHWWWHAGDGYVNSHLPGPLIDAVN